MGARQVAGLSGTVDLAVAGARARIAIEGAEPVGWSVAGRELLWQADPDVWARTSPVLFPIVGRAAGGVIRVDGRTWPMGIHGFAAASRFEVVERTEDSVRLVLRSDERTLAAYPFHFALTADYRLSAEALSVRFEVVNSGDRPMPYALGLHPGFRWPFAGAGREGYAVEFEAEEAPSVPVITPQGLFSNDRRPVPLKGKHLRLTDELMRHEALCFLEARSRSVRFVAPDRSAIRLEVEDFPHFALWSRPPAPFLCIEAWTGHGDPDGFSGELADKPSMRLLAPDAGASHALVMSWQA